MLAIRLLSVVAFLVAGLAIAFGIMHTYFALRASAHFSPKGWLWLTPFSAIYHPAHLSAAGLTYRSLAFQSLFRCIGLFALAFALFGIIIVIDNG